MVVHECNDDAEYRQHMSAAGTKPVIVDFSAKWCGPCKMIGPIFEQLSLTHDSMAFIKVDVDKCVETAALNGVSAMPTFYVFVNGQKVDQLQGADPDRLQKIVEKWSKVVPNSGSDVVPGQMDLQGFIEMNALECLNNCNDTSIRDLLEKPETILRSDCDEQIIITVHFNQPIKLHSIFVKGVGSKSPKKIRVFSNLPKTLDFDEAMGVEPVQIIELGESAQDGEIVGLKFVKFQSVRNVQLFIENNQEGGEVTEIETLKFYGSPVTATNMDNFKRVAGKKGEFGF